jgi:cation-transporting ATPase 13A1
VESGLRFAGFLVFHCPLKEDAVETLRMLADSSHRVSLVLLRSARSAVLIGRAV